MRTGVVSQTRRTEELTNYDGIDVAVNGVKQARGEELRAEGEKLVKRLPRVHQPRPPLRQQPQQTGVYAEVEQLLGDERPHAEAVVSHRYADRARRYSGRQGGLGLGLEVNPYSQQRTLYDGQRVEDYAKAHHTHDGAQLRRIVEVGHERRRGIQNKVKKSADDDVEIEHRVVVGLGPVLLAYQRLREAAVNKRLRHGDEDSQHAYESVVMWRQQARHHNHDEELHALHREALDSAPQHALSRLLL